VYGKDFDSTFAGWIEDGLLRYADTKKAPIRLGSLATPTTERINPRLSREILTSKEVRTENDLDANRFQSRNTEDAYAKVLNDIHK